jgi:iron-sulfur cluster repair protein YtfE (RIC family)
MKPSEVRRELLDQHLRLRIKLKAGRRAADRAARDGTTGELHDVLARIADSLRMHNLREEELLREVFLTLGGWGMVRAKVMLDEHVSEHQHLYEALMVVGRHGDPKVASAKAHELFDRVLRHMAREEKVFLGEDVLSDEAPAPESPEALEG